MQTAYLPSYGASITVYPDGEVRLKARSVRPPREKGESAASAHLARTKKSQKNLEALRDKRLKKVRNFTNEARNTIKRSASAIEREYGAERSGCLTLTCPGSSYRARRLYARCAGYISRRLRQWIHDNYDSPSRRIPLVGVNEIQTKRASKALHSHWVVVLPDGETWDSFRQAIQGFYFKLLCRMSDKLGVDLFQKSPSWSWRSRFIEVADYACDLKPVRKSVAGYLSKYLGKGQDLPRGFDPNLTPDAWWYMNDAARECMNAWTIRLPIGAVTLDQVAEMNDSFIAAFSEVARKIRPIINPYTQDWVGGIAYGNREDTLPIAEQLAALFKNAYQGIAGNAQKMAMASREFFTRGFEFARALDESIRDGHGSDRPLSDNVWGALELSSRYGWARSLRLTG